MEREAQLALRRLAENQRGLFSAAQAAQFGIPYGWLSRSVQAGQLRRCRHGVYAVAGVPPSPWEAIMAAALSAGPSAVVSHSTAASVHRLACAAPVPPKVELTLPRDQGCRLPGIVVHHSLHLEDADVVTKHGIAVTSPARTLIDMAAWLDLRLLAKTLDEGLLQRRFTAATITDALARAAVNHKGRRDLKALLNLRLELPFADSALEMKVYQVLRALPAFVPHHLVSFKNLTYLIDAGWPEAKVGAEIVGRAHRVVSRTAFDRERYKLNALAAAGWRIAHLTAAMTDDEMIDAVRCLLG